MATQETIKQGLEVQLASLRRKRERQTKALSETNESIDAIEHMLETLRKK